MERNLHGAEGPVAPAGAVEGAVYGAFVGVAFPRRGEEVVDELRTTFLFRLDGPKRRRVTLTRAPRIAYKHIEGSRDELFVGEPGFRTSGATKDWWHRDQFNVCTSDFPAIWGQFDVLWESEVWSI